MGQQQLLVLILSIVLVAGVVVAGAHAFEGDHSSENRGLVFQEALSIVHAVQEWKQQDYFLGGGHGVQGFDRVHFGSLGYSYTLLSNRVHKSDVACYILRNTGPRHDAELVIFAPSCSKRDFVARVIISGTGPGDLVWHAE
ncbi:MAG TPA: hypothetical protein VKP65_08170 [Rhodothermales bacterium]|nr:hypothetical protein [Rhodothermales bacterium]